MYVSTSIEVEPGVIKLGVEVSVTVRGDYGDYEEKDWSTVEITAEDLVKAFPGLRYFLVSGS